jgi:hypothetical protein
VTDPPDRRGETVQADRWIVELVPFPDDDRPIGRRVALVLKFAKRVAGLRCRVVRDPRPDEVTP